MGNELRGKMYIVYNDRDIRTIIAIGTYYYM